MEIHLPMVIRRAFIHLAIDVQRVGDERLAPRLSRGDSLLIVDLVVEDREIDHHLADGRFHADADASRGPASWPASSAGCPD